MVSVIRAFLLVAGNRSTGGRVRHVIEATAYGFYAVLWGCYKELEFIRAHVFPPSRDEEAYRVCITLHTPEGVGNTLFPKWYSVSDLDSESPSFQEFD